MGAKLTRYILCFIFSLLLWTGTVSLYVGERPRTTSPAKISCFDKGAGDTLISFLQTGRITAIRDNGRIITVALSSHWSSLPVEAQYGTYETVACYARSQQRAFQLVEVP